MTELNMTPIFGESFAGAFLAHYGVKGMRWGKRKAPERTKVTVQTTPGRKIKTAGGTGQKAHPDAVRAKVYNQKAKKSTTDALSDKELQTLNKRLQMEKQYSELKPTSPTSKTMKFVFGVFANTATQQGKQLLNTTASKQVANMLNNDDED